MLLIIVQFYLLLCVCTVILICIIWKILFIFKIPTLQYFIELMSLNFSCVLCGSYTDRWFWFYVYDDSCPPNSHKHWKLLACHSNCYAVNNSKPALRKCDHCRTDSFRRLLNWVPHDTHVQRVECKTSKDEEDWDEETYHVSFQAVPAGSVVAPFDEEPGYWRRPMSTTRPYYWLQSEILILNLRTNLLVVGSSVISKID